MIVTTISEILDCDPVPDEIIVHIDGNDEESEQEIKKHFSNVKILKSQINIGPGGGRNRLIEAAQNEIVASFDDDSYPLDQDYFARLLQVFQEYPDTSVVAAAIYYQNQSIEDDTQSTRLVATFEGCGCAYKKTDFLKTDGYMQLQWAYGAEEVDIAIQLHAQERKILQTDWLRVYHNTYRQHHKNNQINAANISNIALLAYVRYPLSMWGRAVLQVFNRVLYSIKMQRYAGIILGLLSIPKQIWSYRKYRKPVPRKALEKYFNLRKNTLIIE
ncbi:hypothetical protein NUACC21_49780 [Scytonema sp. NUACC21]